MGRNGDTADRPRERLWDLGPAALSDAELVALVLRTGVAGVPALDQGRRILETLGGRNGLARVTAAELVTIPGIGPARASSVVAAAELGRRIAAAPRPNGAVFRTARDVYDHFRGSFAGLRQEVFSVVLVDARHRKLREVPVSVGSLTASIVHPREVFGPAVREAACSVLLVHNHPSGDPAPSPEDVELTRRLRESGNLLGIRVLDHVIVGAGSYFSFVDAGYW